MTAAGKIALVGLRASGKSSVGRALAGELGIPFVDLDDEVLREARSAATPDAHTALVSVGDVLARSGETRFREIESRVLERVLRRPDALVLATGGGTIVSARNRALLSACTHVVWLDVPVTELERRLREDPASRPALMGRDNVAEVAEIARERASFYSEAAHWRLDAGDSPIRRLVHEIRAHLATLGGTGSSNPRNP